MTLELFRGRRLAPGLLLVLVAGAASLPAPARVLEIEDMFRMRRVSDPQISPDGHWVAYVATDVLKSENRTQSTLWIVPSAGGDPRPLTRPAGHDGHPRWSPDGRWVAFESDRGGVQQIWIVPASGGGPRRLTALETGASDPVWSPRGDRIAFVSAVFPEFSSLPFAEAERRSRERLAGAGKSKVKARIFTELLFRHWDSWMDGRRLHLFVMPVSPRGRAGEPRDLTPGDRDALPTSSTFVAGDEFAFSPDGKTLAHTAEPLPTRVEAWSTNLDILALDLATGKETALTVNPAADGLPRYSPDGRLLAYRAQARPGCESDRWQIWLLDLATGRRRSLTAAFDASIDYFTWSPDGRSLYFEASERGESPLWRIGLGGGAPERIVAGGTNDQVTVSPDGRWFAYSHDEFARPAELFRCAATSGGPTRLTRTNDAVLADVSEAPPESVTVPGAGGTRIQMWIIRPPHFDPTHRYPLVFWVHGGPQVPFMNGWSYRWNAELWAAQGYVVALPNPRGSPGFGQKFTDEISRDWGGKIYDDLMDCLAWLESRPYVDRGRMAAAGASFGGYMMNWFEGHTNKFKALVTHDGVYNFESMYGTTDELWFAEHEQGIPWRDPDFDRFSPNRYAANFRTPDLIIHNELDFRVPIGEGYQLFTALQRQGVPSKFLSFPDEGHWVLKPQNSELWHRTVFDWLARYLKGP